MTWLITLTRNRAVDRLRASRSFEKAMAVAQEVVDVHHSGESTGSTTHLDSGMRQSIRPALGGLPPDQRQAIELAFFGGLTQTEIAGKLGAPLGTIKARIRRGLIELRGVLKSLNPMVDE